MSWPYCHIDCLPVSSFPWLSINSEKIFVICDILCVLADFVSHITNQDSFLCWNAQHFEKMFKDKYYRKRGCRWASFRNDTAFDQYWALRLLTLTRALHCTAPLCMQNNRDIIVIHITHRNVTEASRRIFSGPQKGRNGISPTLCHHRATNSITCTSWHTWQWHGAFDNQWLSDSWERVISCSHWYLLQETHADEEGKTSLPWRCLCKQACHFQRKAHFMVPRTVSAPSPLGTCSSKETKMCPLPTLSVKRDGKFQGAIQSTLTTILQ